MAVELFEINLEHDIDEQYQYEPGEMIRGHVLVKLKEPIKVKAIQVQVKGEATVSWEEEVKRNAQTFRADETYVDVTQNLLYVKDGDSQELKAGKHRFPLEYTLPANLPSSFIGKFGSITYVAKATLKEDKKFSMNTLITSEPFLVLRRLDLTQDPEMSQRIERTSEKRLWGALVFCVSGKVTMNVAINKPGLLPGEDIFLDAEIVNDSPRVVRAVQASIIMHSTFHAKNNTRYNTQIVNKKRDEWEMMMGEGRRWKGVRLTIPPYIPESRLDGCDIIDIRYELVYRIEISGNNEMKIVIPITIGTSQGMGSENKIMGNGTGEGTSEGDQEDADANGNINGINAEVMDEEAENFRRPMEPGDTRRNPLFTTNSEEHGDGPQESQTNPEG